MSWQVKRDGFTAIWHDRVKPLQPFVRVLRDRDAKLMEFDMPSGGVHDGLDFMHRCITNTQAELGI